MKEVNFDLNLAVNPYVGIAVYENELITRLVKKYKDFKYVGTVCFNRENKKGLEKLNIPINTALAPYGMTFNRARTWGIPYNWLSRSFSDIYMFWANSIPAFPIRGKVVSVIHDLTPLYTTKNPEAIQRYRQIIKRCLERSDFIITVSKFSENDIRDKFGYMKDNIKIVYSASDFDRFYHNVSDCDRQRIRKKYGLPEKYMLYIGNTYEYKNIKGIIDAFSLLPVEIQNEYKFVCAHSAEYLIRYAKEKKVIDKVCFLNGIDEEDKPAIYQMAEMTFLLSYHEGFGTPIIESMAAGTPVIASNVSCMPETSGDAALLVSPDKCEDIADAIEQIINNSLITQGLINKGYQNAQKFSWDTSAERLYSVLKTLS